MKRKERPKSNKKPYYLSTLSIIGIHTSFCHFVLLLLTDQLFRCRFAIRLLLLRLLLLAHTHLHIYTHTYISEHNRFIYNICTSISSESGKQCLRQPEIPDICWRSTKSQSLSFSSFFLWFLCAFNFSQLLKQLRNAESTTENRMSFNVAIFSNFTVVANILTYANCLARVLLL